MLRVIASFAMRVEMIIGRFGDVAVWLSVGGDLGHCVLLIRFMNRFMTGA